jgi:hypothetical protein
VYEASHSSAQVFLVGFYDSEMSCFSSHRASAEGSGQRNEVEACTRLLILSAQVLYGLL